jgi:putative sigma-54 modulation protein
MLALERRSPTRRILRFLTSCSFAFFARNRLEIGILPVLLDFLPSPAQINGMKLILMTHNVTLTKAIEDHILSRIDKLEHIDRFAINARVILEHDDTNSPERQFKCSLRLRVPGPDLFAEDFDADLYAAIDKVTKKIEQQIRKRHNKHKARKHTDASRTKRRRQESDSDES